MDEWVKLHGEEPTNSVMGIIIVLDNPFNSLPAKIGSFSGFLRTLL